MAHIVCRPYNGRVRTMHRRRELEKDTNTFVDRKAYKKHKKETAILPV
jgi:hypothetical protein